MAGRSYFESHLKYQIKSSEITLTRRNKKTPWGVNVSNIIARLYDGLELYLATVQSLDEKGIAKKMGLKERDQIVEVNGRSVRGWQSEDLHLEFTNNLSVTVVVISIDDRTLPEEVISSRVLVSRHIKLAGEATTDKFI